jgi:hypothetical protein
VWTWKNGVVIVPVTGGLHGYLRPRAGYIERQVGTEYVLSELPIKIPFDNKALARFLGTYR